MSELSKLVITSLNLARSLRTLLRLILAQKRFSEQTANVKSNQISLTYLVYLIQPTYTGLPSCISCHHYYLKLNIHYMISCPDIMISYQHYMLQEPHPNKGIRLPMNYEFNHTVFSLNLILFYIYFIVY